MHHTNYAKSRYLKPALMVAAVLIVSVILAGLFSSCSRPPAYEAAAPAPIAAAPAAVAPVAAAPAAAAPAPVIVNAPAASSGAGDMLLGAAAGYMIGSAGNRQVAAPAPARPIVHKTIINKTIVQQRPRPIVRQQPIAKGYRASRPSTPSRSFSARSSRR